MAPRVEGDYDALVVMECSDLARPGVAGLEGYYTINIDHHPGNAMYGAINWFDETAAACGELVAAIIDALDVAWTPEIAHARLPRDPDRYRVFRHSHITARTFEVVPAGRRGRRRRGGHRARRLRAEQRRQAAS